MITSLGSTQGVIKDRLDVYKPLAGRLSRESQIINGSQPNSEKVEVVTMANNFSFSSFNKERLFTFDCNKIAGNYTNLEAMYQEDGEGKEYQIKGVYISTSSQFDPEAPIVALANTYVNLPQHQLADIKAMLANKGAINAINAGFAGFTIRQYERTVKSGKKLIAKTCYQAEWCDVIPSDFEEETVEE